MVHYLSMQNSPQLNDLLKIYTPRYFGFENSPLSLAEPATGQAIFKYLTEADQENLPGESSKFINLATKIQPNDLLNILSLSSGIAVKFFNLLSINKTDVYKNKRTLQKA